MLALLARKPFKDVTVDELAREAGLSRTAFYFYFRDKNEVLAAAAEDASAEMFREADRWWHGEGEPEELVRSALTGIGTVFTGHADVMRATFEVTTYDADFAAFYKGLVERFVSATAEHLRRERDAGRLRAGLDPQSVAEALVWMAERCNHAFVLVEGRPVSELAATLTVVWVNALYPDPGQAPAPPA
jgi:AcrR family transcriptional regulator